MRVYLLAVIIALLVMPSETSAWKFLEDVEATGFTTNCVPSDNNCGVRAANDGDKVGAIPGDCWFNLSMGKQRCMDNTSTNVTIGP